MYKQNLFQQSTDAASRHYKANGYSNKHNRDVERGVIAFVCVTACLSIILISSFNGVVETIHRIEDAIYNDRPANPDESKRLLIDAKLVIDKLLEKM